MRIKSLSVLLISAVAILPHIQCKPDSNIKEKKVGVITFIKGDAVKITGNTEEPLHHGDILQSDLVIKTKDKSMVDITFSDKSIVRLKEFTTLKLSLMAESKKGGQLTDLELNTGKIVNVVNKINEDGHYTVKAPTAIAGVRGTVFEVSADTETTVFVAEGEVEVNGLIGKEENHSLLKDRGVTIRGEKDYLFGEEKKTEELLKEAGEMKGNKTDISEETIKLTSKLANVKTEEELSKVFNKDIEIIIMKDGRTLRGVIVSMSEGKLLVQTIKGSHFINEAEVQKVKYVNE